MSDRPKIAVIGLGYVGLPLAVALARKFRVVGFDVDLNRIEQLRSGHDRTAETSPETLEQSTLALTATPADCAGADIYIVTVPTPVDSANRPDLSAVLSATRTVASLIDPERRPTIVYESTVYPGVTEDICGPEIERVSGFRRGRDFRLGYSPERINPGDTIHRIDRITKVVAGEDAEVVAQLAKVYGSITDGGVFEASSIKAAEAAKVIENAQRDINIAFMNEVAQICGRIDISVWDVLAAARTKWNFLPFEPGLVGGHCIGIDPYYLSHLAQTVGHDPHVILAGREINDGMAAWVADRVHAHRGRAGKALVMGATFKENVPDLRNSKAIDLAARLKTLGYEVTIADPIASAEDMENQHGQTLGSLSDGPFDLLVIAVAHDEYRAMSAKEFGELLVEGGTLADLKNLVDGRLLDPSLDHWTL